MQNTLGNQSTCSFIPSREWRQSSGEEGGRLHTILPNCLKNCIKLRNFPVVAVEEGCRSNRRFANI